MKTIENLQFLILNEKGEIIFSDNTLFSVEDLPSTSVFDWSPFVESIFPNLFQENKKIFTFHKVKTIHEFLSGTYDYSFYKNDGEDLPSQIIWTILDRSTFYDKLTKEQQYNQQRIIEREIMTFKNKELPHIQLS